MTQKTEKSISTIFSSPVSIKLSSGTSLKDLDGFEKPDPDGPRIPISILLTVVTFGVIAVSIGKGR